MLDSRWVDAIHTRLLVRYGAKWLNLFAGVDQDLVKADWAEQLSGIGPDGIKHAMEHLPDDSPPNVAQFKALCIRGPQKVAAIAWSKEADPAVVAEVVKIRERIAAVDPKAWAYRLAEREKNGDRLTMAQKTMWRAALNEQRNAA